MYQQRVVDSAIARPERPSRWLWVLSLYTDQVLDGGNMPIYNLWKMEIVHIYRMKRDLFEDLNRKNKKYSSFKTINKFTIPKDPSWAEQWWHCTSSLLIRSKDVNSFPMTKLSTVSRTTGCEWRSRGMCNWCLCSCVCSCWWASQNRWQKITSLISSALVLCCWTTLYDWLWYTITLRWKIPSQTTVNRTCLEWSLMAYDIQHIEF